MPANGETAVIPTPVKIPASVSTQLLKEEASRYDLKPPDPKRPRLLQGVLIMKVINDTYNEIQSAGVKTSTVVIENCIGLSVFQ